MDNHYNIYICGVGGQGIIKTSVIIGEAAMNQGLNVVMSEIHGMSQRGGSVSTELKIGDYNSSIIPEHGADMLLSFEPIETIRGLNKVNDDSIGTTGAIEVEVKDLPTALFNFISMVPTDMDIVHNYGRGI